MALFLCLQAAGRGLCLVIGQVPQSQHWGFQKPKAHSTGNCLGKRQEARGLLQGREKEVGEAAGAKGRCSL